MASHSIENLPLTHDDLLFNWEDFETLDVSAQFEYFKESLIVMDAQDCNREIQAKIIQQMCLQPGNKILEVGCGLGLRAKLIAESANNQIEVTAVDKSIKILDAAKNISRTSNLTYQQADAEALPFPDGYFDVVTGERLLICFENPILALKEMFRVLKPGGILAITDFDPASIVLTPLDFKMQQTFMDIYMPSFCDPLIGRKLPALFKQVGIERLEVEIDISYERDISQLETIIPMQKVLDGGVKAGYLSKNTADQWLTNLRIASSNGSFLYAITVISVLGKKPH